MNKRDKNELNGKVCHRDVTMHGESVENQYKCVKITMC